MNTEKTKIIAKSKTREEMTTTGADLILKDRELLLETEGVDDKFTVRFKIGDGATPYKELPYISSIYKLFPNFTLYNNNYTFGVDVLFKED